ncbi:Longin-like domain-containing protein [Syncephalastrum racemosum]|uniref:Synaptobrevin homolog YKT6 n=1 Tax=Syncephalastrum racemosum TaxID=13706 RepID=A0A1X2HAW5_SYNRA|nr:Longin-like domain-containing protein [Syncephalastrum racemosum]
MQLLSILLLRTGADGKAEVLTSSFDLTRSFSFFERGSVKEFMTFTAATIAERTQPGVRQSVQQNESDHVAHVYSHPRGVTGVIFSDKEYPMRVAFGLLNKILDEFLVKFPAETWKPNLPYPELEDYLKKYQDPKQADTIMRVQDELNETTAILQKTIDSVLQRGEKLDSLVDRSEALSSQSKMFYKTAKKTNSCCVVM